MQGAVLTWRMLLRYVRRGVGRAGRQVRVPIVLGATREREREGEERGRHRHRQRGMLIREEACLGGSRGTELAYAGQTINTDT
eukprot:1205599-Rhodomonas_salina.1